MKVVGRVIYDMYMYVYMHVWIDVYISGRYLIDLLPVAGPFKGESRGAGEGERGLRLHIRGGDLHLHIEVCEKPKQNTYRHTCISAKRDQGKGGPGIEVCEKRKRVAEGTCISAQRQNHKTEDRCENHHNNTPRGPGIEVCYTVADRCG